MEVWNSRAVLQHVATEVQTAGGPSKVRRRKSMEVWKEGVLEARRRFRGVKVKSSGALEARCSHMDACRSGDALLACNRGGMEVRTLQSCRGGSMEV